MCMEYDESLTDNVFFQEIQKNHKNILDNATKENWIICIPRIDTVQDTNFTTNDVFEHVLIPSKENNSQFYTLTEKSIIVENKSLHIDNNNKETENINILFEETFYISESEKYTTWCIDRPLNSERSQFDYIIKQPKSIYDCIEILTKFCSDVKVLELIETECDKVLAAHVHLETESLQNLRNIAKELFLTVLDKVLKHSNAYLLNKSPMTFNNFKLSTETYIHFYTFNHLFSAICNATSQLDGSFNKIIRNNSHVDFKDLGISSSLQEYMSYAKLQLNKINNLNTVLDKVNCFKLTFSFCNVKIKPDSSRPMLSADDFLKITVFLIIKSNIYNWIANLTYITQFCNSFCLFNENSFFVTTLEAAIQYLQNTTTFIKWTLVPETIETTNTDTDKLSILFKCIKLGNLKGVDEIILKHASAKTVEENKNKLCHPLCSCDICENLLSDKISINSYDDKGWSPLHVASYYGQPQIVEYLLSKGAQVNARDFLNNSSLHHACSRGHQNVLLLLLLAGAEVNSVEYNGNTPLHFAAYNGHENCVKALLYYEQKNSFINVNSQNNYGDTPLHLASKLGFSDIITILLQYGSNPYIKNFKNQDTFEVAHNYYIKQIINLTKRYQSNDHLKNTTHLKGGQLHQKERAIRSYNDNEPSSQKDFKIQPLKSDQLKKIELVLKAIEGNDVPLTCFYLGIPLLKNQNQEESSCSCHPLCLCEKCQQTDEKNITTLSKPQDIIHINACNLQGYTPLHTAAKFGRKDIVRLLLDSGASINLKTYEHNYTALHLACCYQRLLCVQELLKSGNCNVDVQDIKGNTPLHYACLNNNTKIVELLLSHGANCSLKNIDLKTAQQEAESRMLFKVTKIFKDRYEKMIMPTNSLFDS